MSPFLDELERLARKATPGPWCHEPSRKWDVRNDDGWTIISVFENNENAPYIAALSPERILALVECVRAADEMSRDGYWESVAYDAARAKLDATP